MYSEGRVGSFLMQRLQLIKVDDYSHFFSFNFLLRDQNSQHFNEDLLAVNASAFSFVLFFKTIDYTGASHCLINGK